MALSIIRLQKGRLQKGRLQKGKLQEGKLQEGKLQEGKLQEGKLQESIFIRTVPLYYIKYEKVLYLQRQNQTGRMKRAKKGSERNDYLRSCTSGRLLHGRQFDW